MLKKKFYLYIDSLESIKKFLTLEQIGQFTLAILSYQTTGTLPEGLEKIVYAMLDPIIGQFKRDDENYKKTCERNAANGSKGGRPKTEDNPQKPTETHSVILGSKKTHSNPKKPDTDTDTDTDTDYIPQTPLLENPKLANLWEGVVEAWHIIAEQQGAKFTNDEWNAIKGYSMAKPRLQPHQITGAIIQLNDWGQQGLDLRKSLLDGIQSSVRCTKLDQPFMAIVLDAKGNQLNRQQVIDRRNRIIEQEERDIA